jgi:hypothetical protein
MLQSSITANQLKALRVIETRLARQNCLWVITGSLAFALQGLDFVPSDIDLQADRAGAYCIEAALSDFVTRPVQFQEAEKIRSHFGSAEIESVQVEIMGDLQKREFAGEWTTPTNISLHRRSVDFHGMRLPVLSLSYEHTAYLMLGRTETASKIKAWLDRDS